MDDVAHVFDPTVDLAIERVSRLRLSTPHSGSGSPACTSAWSRRDWLIGWDLYAHRHVCFRPADDRRLARRRLWHAYERSTVWLDPGLGADEGHADAKLDTVLRAGLKKFEPGGTRLRLTRVHDAARARSRAQWLRNRPAVAATRPPTRAEAERPAPPHSVYISEIRRRPQLLTDGRDDVCALASSRLHHPYLLAPSGLRFGH